MSTENKTILLISNDRNVYEVNRKKFEATFEKVKLDLNQTVINLPLAGPLVSVIALLCEYSGVPIYELNFKTVEFYVKFGWTAIQDLIFTIEDNKFYLEKQIATMTDSKYTFSFDIAQRYVNILSAAESFELKHGKFVKLISCNDIIDSIVEVSIYNLAINKKIPLLFGQAIGEKLDEENRIFLYCTQRVLLEFESMINEEGEYEEKEYSTDLYEIINNYGPRDNIRDQDGYSLYL